MSDTTNSENTTPEPKPSRKPQVLAAVSTALFGTSLAAASFLGARSGVLTSLTKAVSQVPVKETIEVAKGLIK